jgi:hypothetical protein
MGKLEIGKLYRTRSGLTAEIIGVQDCALFPFLALIHGIGMTAYMSCGSWSEFGVKAVLDIVDQL